MPVSTPGQTPGHIVVIDIWHQGAIVAAGLAEAGHAVVGLSLAGDAAALTAGVTSVLEPGLGDLIRSMVSAGRLCFADDPAKAIPGAAFVFLSTDTPVDDDDRPHLDGLFEALRLAGPGIDRPVTLVVTAQVPVGTSEALRAALAKATAHPVAVAYVPEFLQLGQALDRFRNADRFVVGADDVEVRAQVAALFAPLGRPIVETGLRTAELAKHAANAFLALSVSFINEVGDLAEATGADVTDVARILRLDRRIGPYAYLGAGLGFSGGTLGRELRTLQAIGEREAIPTVLTNAAWDVNATRPAAVLRLVARAIGAPEGRTLAVGGLAYKAGTPTLRRSRPLEVTRALIAAGWAIRAFDPLVDPATLPSLPDFEACPSLAEASRGAAGLVLLSGGAGISDASIEAVSAALDGRTVVDAVGAWDRDVARHAGLVVVSPGRAS